MTFQSPSEDKVWPLYLYMDAKLDRLFLRSRHHWPGEHTHVCTSDVLVPDLVLTFYQDVVLFYYKCLMVMILMG